MTFQKDQKTMISGSICYSLNLQCINASAYHFLAPFLQLPSTP